MNARGGEEEMDNTREVEKIDSCRDLTQERAPKENHPKHNFDTILERIYASNLKSIDSR